MGQLADALEEFLRTDPSKTALVEMCMTLDVPPSMRTTRARCVRTIESMIANEREHDTIARLASRKRE